MSVTSISMDEKEYWKEQPFYSCSFLTPMTSAYDNVSDFQSIGHYVQASKAKLFGDMSAFWAIMKTKRRVEQEKLGSAVTGFDLSVWILWKPQILQTAMNCIQTPHLDRSKQWWSKYVDLVNQKARADSDKLTRVWYRKVTSESRPG